MNIENSIQVQYRELISYCGINGEYSELYKGIEQEELREIFATLHYELTTLFRKMNERLPTDENEGYFWADTSRKLIKIISITFDLYKGLKNSSLAFEVDKYYLDLITKCRNFLKSSFGSKIPPHMEAVNLYYTIPIFIPSSVIQVENPQTTLSFSPIQIGSGSYANVYKYKDTFYDRYFVIKRAGKNLTTKELKRFRLEFDEMKGFSSPYILEVYNYDETRNEYVMEFMDYTLDTFIQKNNSIMTTELRKKIVNQILHAFEYVHSKDRLHRDISPKNILLKEFDDTIIVKIADFGLVKVPDSDLTSANTEFKGYFNDPSLAVEGFEKYSVLHETYALTRIIYFVMTGKTNTDSIVNSKLKDFVLKGLNSDKSLRFKSIDEMARAFRSIV